MSFTVKSWKFTVLASFKAKRRLEFSEVEGEELQALKKANPNNRGRMRFMRLFF
jgi:hypothetical protein